MTANAAIGTSPSSIAISMDAVDGKVTVSKGLVTGTFTVGYSEASSKLKTTSQLIVSKDAKAELSAFTDSK